MFDTVGPNTKGVCAIFHHMCITKKKKTPLSVI